MLDYAPELLARLLMADREGEAQAIARAAEAVGRRRGLRARFAIRLAHIALALHREAAAAAGLPPGIGAGPAAAEKL